VFVYMHDRLANLKKTLAKLEGGGLGEDLANETLANMRAYCMTPWTVSILLWAIGQSLII
jgi:hypothetical protein